MSPALAGGVFFATREAQNQLYSNIKVSWKQFSLKGAIFPVSNAICFMLYEGFENLDPQETAAAGAPAPWASCKTIVKGN